MYGALPRRFSLMSSLPLLLILKCIVHVVAKLVGNFCHKIYFGDTSIYVVQNIFL